MASRHGISANNWYVRELSRVIGRHVSDDLADEIRDGMRSGRHGYRTRSSKLKGFVGGE
jgi:hypothetical protein